MPADTLEGNGLPLIDIRSPEEYTGERTSIPDYPQEGSFGVVIFLGPQCPMGAGYFGQRDVQAADGT